MERSGRARAAVRAIREEQYRLGRERSRLERRLRAIARRAAVLGVRELRQLRAMVGAGR